MKGLFIPDITAEMFRNGCLESIETLMAEGEIYDIDYPLEQETKTGHWALDGSDNGLECINCGCVIYANDIMRGEPHYCPNCGAKMEDEKSYGEKLADEICKMCF